MSGYRLLLQGKMSTFTASSFGIVLLANAFAEILWNLLVHDLHPAIYPLPPRPCTMPALLQQGCGFVSCPYELPGLTAPISSFARSNSMKPANCTIYPVRVTDDDFPTSALPTGSHTHALTKRSELQ